MYIVMNELNVSPENKEMLHQRFGKASGNMAQVPGCIEFMFLSNVDESQKEVVYTKWESKQDYENWLASDAFSKAHGGQKQSGQKPASSANELHAYEVVHHYTK
ncbi:heme-degrading monooxygenase IsdG [Bacillus sp. JCM 19046]|uniref:Heme oxygenase (Staphylobilin-producing) n=1 Tax=Shouchella xiaoxiensis TaxID=766895 RepID=A0ABS2SQY4_9BACI|nr:antibiotic biosynthesis monooxygenase family protein [Shouchella xiaoxiensis]MBM7837914.1 heme oxygenase (staphylobilin-producing) [Shouchella xiaoxiensis]GAF12217.1 heme-degrading monooxygenase IsdG [Bacillus sp. JCM 19045]GAF19138.1 heme-degrading monooxygenase IsdG [Bacillus sp. JCM 19046]